MKLSVNIDQQYPSFPPTREYTFQAAKDDEDIGADTEPEAAADPAARPPKSGPRKYL